MSVTLAMINNTSFISHTSFLLIESTEKLTFFCSSWTGLSISSSVRWEKPWGLRLSDDLGVWYNEMTLTLKTGRRKQRKHPVVDVYKGLKDKPWLLYAPLYWFIRSRICLIGIMEWRQRLETPWVKSYLSNCMYFNLIRKKCC